MRGVTSLTISTNDALTSQRPVVIVVDDSPTICMIVEGTFRRMSCDVKGYTDPIQALRDVVESQRPLPDVAFVDLLLPKMNGYDLIRYLRSQPQLHRLAIIAISRLDGPLPRLKARLAGADAYLVKPLKIQDLIDAAIVHSQH